MTTTYLTGNTYPHRQTIAQIPGAKWDAAKKAWVITPGTMREREIQSAAIQALRRVGVTVSTY